MEDTKSLLPYRTADSSLRALAGQAEGFGRHAIGGLHGDVYHVTTLDGMCAFPSPMRSRSSKI